jgi:hypothetical protein
MSARINTPKGKTRQLFFLQIHGSQYEQRDEGKMRGTRLLSNSTTSGFQL